MQARILRAVKPVQINRAFATYKTSTGLVGLPVQPDGNNVLVNISNVALQKLKVSLSLACVLLCFVFNTSVLSLLQL
jgi:hypothetical protein